jgi:hypothetical protein
VERAVRRLVALVCHERDPDHVTPPLSGSAGLARGQADVVIVDNAPGTDSRYL